MSRLDLLEIIRNRNSADSTKTSYPELHLFRQQIEVQTAHHKPFTAYKKKINRYRLIFIGFSLFYLIFASLLFFKLSPYLTNYVMGSYSFLIKNTICAACISGSIICGMIGIFLNAEREAVHGYYKKARKRLEDIYHHNLAKVGIKRYFSSGKERNNILHFKEIYHDSLDRLHHVRDESLCLVERITHSESLEEGRRELLLNHCLLEMNDKLVAVINQFKSPDTIKLLSSVGL